MILYLAHDCDEQPNVFRIMPIRFAYFSYRLATGIALSAFGAGAALAPSVIHALVDSFAVSPHYIGDCLLTSGGESATQSLVELTTLSDGSQVIATNSPVGEAGTPVVVATEADIAKISAGLVTTGPGVYEIGTGDTGVAKAVLLRKLDMISCYVCLDAESWNHHVIHREAA